MDSKSPLLPVIATLSLFAMAVFQGVELFSPQSQVLGWADTFLGRRVGTTRPAVPTGLPSLSPSLQPAVTTLPRTSLMTCTNLAAVSEFLCQDDLLTSEELGQVVPTLGPTLNPRLGQLAGRGQPALGANLGQSLVNRGLSCDLMASILSQLCADGDVTHEEIRQLLIQNRQALTPSRAVQPSVTRPRVSPRISVAPVLD